MLYTNPWSNIAKHCRNAFILLSVLLLVGCTTQQPASTGAPENSTVKNTPKTTPLISNPKVGTHEKSISVSILISNSNNEAVPIASSQFALTSGEHVLSPTNDSEIPSQIPANSKAQIILQFNSSTFPDNSTAELAFQPHNHPEEFVSLGTIKLTSTEPNSSSAPTISGPTLTLIGDNGNNVTLPIVGIKATYGVDFPTPPSINPTSQITSIHFNVPSNQADELTAYWVNEGFNNQGFLFIGPRGWIPISASIGVDGSKNFTLQSPSDITQKMTYEDDGACQGCSISNIGTYFPGMSQWASQQGFAPNAFPDFQSGYQLNQNTAEYSINSLNAGYETNGIACKKANTTAGYFFAREEITLPTSKHALETTILNYLLHIYH